MATNRSSKTNLDETRQMLNELDALMERMLALPVQDLEENSEDPLEEMPDYTRIDPPVSSDSLVSRGKKETTLSASMTALDEAQEYLDSAELIMPELENPPEDIPSANYRLESPPDLENPTELEPPEPYKEPLSSFRKPTLAEPEEKLHPPLIIQQKVPGHSNRGEDSPTSGYGFLTPLVWCNQLFDQTMEGLGSPGQWLRGSKGRTLLGFLGLIFCLLAFLWWFRDRSGWN